MPGPDCRKSPEPAVIADDEFYLRRMKEILQQTDGSSAECSSSSTVLFGSQLHPVQLLDHVFIGSQRNADNLEVLRSYGITHVLNCAGLRRYDFTRSPYPKDTGIKGFLMFSAEVRRFIRCFLRRIIFYTIVRRPDAYAYHECSRGVKVTRPKTLYLQHRHQTNTIHFYASANNSTQT